MAATFLDLTNQLLRRLNEVEIAPSQFEAVRGVQALAKDAVRASIASINQREFEWPFNAAEHTQILTPGQTEYGWPPNLKIPEWTSFAVTNDAALKVGYRPLHTITRDEWYRGLRQSDRNAPNGRGIPAYVFKSHGPGFGVSPSPDKAYTVSYRYFLAYANLSAALDEVRIPEAFQSVIIDGALYHMYMFKDNPESASVTVQAFEAGLKSMENTYLGASEYVYDRRVNFGGNPFGRGRYAR